MSFKHLRTMSNDLFNDFRFTENPSTTIIEKYKGKLDSKVLDIWQEYGFGEILNGYIKIVNPDNYKDLLQKSWSDYNENYFVLFATGMGDLIVKKDDFLYFLDFRHRNIEVAGKDYDIFFTRCLPDEEYLQDEFSWEPYKDAVDLLGIPAHDECFGYEPILVAGGNKDVKKLKKVKLIEHVELIVQFTGKI